MFERISRRDAIRRGLPRYFDGKPCKYGHTAQRTTRSGNCTACLLMYLADWRKRNPEARKRYYLSNKDQENAACREYYKANRDRRLAQAREYRQQHPERAKRHGAQWRAEHPQYQGDHRKRNGDRYVVYVANRRERLATGKLSHDIRQTLFEKQAGLCACCGQPLGSRFHLDHVVPLSRGGTNTDSNVQLLRAKCNLNKGSRVASL